MAAVPSQIVNESEESYSALMHNDHDYMLNSKLPKDSDMNVMQSSGNVTNETLPESETSLYTDITPTSLGNRLVSRVEQYTDSNVIVDHVSIDMCSDLSLEQNGSHASVELHLETVTKITHDTECESSERVLQTDAYTPQTGEMSSDRSKYDLKTDVQGINKDINEVH